MKINILILPIFILFIVSCQSTPKNIAYFQDLDEKIVVANADNNPLIRVGDQLLITVSSSSSLDQELVAQFNLPLNSYLAPGSTEVNQVGNLQTYFVNGEGYITYPVLGRLKLGGITKENAITFMTELISKYVNDAIVNIEILSFRVTVLGEVNRPGLVLARNERLTILEAIGAAGDLTVFGKRENVLLIRENNGVKEFFRFDLTKSDIFSSRYYYLQQDDVIVVESNDTRKRASKFGASENYSLSIYSTVLSTLSLIASTVITIITINNNKK